MQSVRSPSSSAALKESLATLQAHFAASGAEHLDLPYLYPSEELLNLYGEDLRARAFLYGDAERGDELCLRPDFTVPVALTHRQLGWDREAAYSYAGPVFRLQPMGENRPVEYVQAGFERFGQQDLAAADASAFLTLRKGVQLLGVTSLFATIGDLSIALAVLDALELPAHRRDALKRHLWRPARFQDLIARARLHQIASPERHELGALDLSAKRRKVEAAGERVGNRSVSDVVERLEDLAEQANDPVMSQSDADLISDVLSVHGPVNGISKRIRRLTHAAGVDISATLDRFDSRLEHLLDAGCDPDELFFDAAFGRSLEYYDGFVFEIRSKDAEAHPPLAGGGRYNAMTLRLGAVNAVPAIGGIVRPEAVMGSLS